MEYREANEADIAAMARIRAANWETEAYWKQRISDYRNGKLHPQQALLPRIIYVAAEGDIVTGFIAGHLTRRFGCEGELEWIDVIPEHRRSGIASGLLQQLAAWFIEQQARHICVNCAPDNPVAQNFYKRHGAEQLNAYWLVWKDIRAVTQRKQ